MLHWDVASTNCLSVRRRLSGMHVQWQDEQERCEGDIEQHRAAGYQGIQVLSLSQTPTACSSHSPQERSVAC